MKYLMFFTLCLMLAAWTGNAKAQQNSPAQALRGCRATYNDPPRLPNGHVDLKRLLDELADLHANTYDWLIWHKPTDWDDLHAFLPLARRKNIKVWVNLAPPSESPPNSENYSEPFRLAYQRWAVEIGKLSARESNLVAWSIDDFYYDLKLFTPEYIREMTGKAKKENPRLAFLPCLYFKQLSPAFAERYRGLFDGLLFPYRGESVKANLKDPTLVAREIAQIRAMMGRDLPVILDVYATAHSELGATTSEYVREVMERGYGSADGVMIYCHQNPRNAPEKYNIIKTMFTKWDGEKQKP